MNQGVLRLKLSHLGLPRTLAHYTCQALCRVAEIGVYHLLCLEPDDLVAPQSAVPDLQFALVEAERLRREALDPGSGLTPSGVESELAKGDACFGAFVGGVLASYAFIADGSTRLQDDVFVQFDPRWAFSRWAFTRAEFRGLHLHPALKGHALEAQVRRGRRGILSLVGLTNFESLQAAARLGCRPVGLAGTARPAGRRLVWSSKSCGAYGLSLRVAPPENGGPGGPQGT